MPSVALLSPKDETWRTFAAQHATSPLQHPAWLDTLTGAYGLHARIMTLTDLQGSIVAGLPMIRGRLPWRKGWTSLPFTDTLEPVASGVAHRDELLIAAAQQAGAEPIVVRTQAALPGWISRQVGTVQVLDLADGVDGVLRGAKSKTRQNINLARKAGLIARPIASREEYMGPNLDLIAQSRRRLGAPTQPRRYWSRVWELHEQDRALTIGVYLGERLLANATFILGDHHATFKYSASDSQTRDLRTNYLAFAAALDHIAARGMRSMDFGITDLHNTSLRRYKVHWGGEEQPAYFSATDADLLPDTLEPGRLLTTMIQRAPVFVGRTVGSLAYPFAA
jgi:CelD/BcsL family acetyltransferase involved in cellulose biosynthesis